MIARVRLRFVDDVEVDTCTAQIVSIVIYGSQAVRSAGTGGGHRDPLEGY